MNDTRTLIGRAVTPVAVVLVVVAAFLTVSCTGLTEDASGPAPAATVTPTVPGGTSTDAAPASGPTLLAPAADAVLPAGQPVTITGRGTAPEGTLLLRIVDIGTGDVVDDRHVTAGANGHDGPFTTDVDLPAGAYTVTVWVPDDSDGESGRPDPSASRTFTVSE